MVARSLLVVSLCLACAHAAAFPTGTYFPLPDNATWTYSVSDGTTNVRTVVGNKLLYGSTVKAIVEDTGNESYFTNDPFGVRFYGAFFADSPNGSGTERYSLPVVYLAREASIGTPVQSAGQFYVDYPGNSAWVNYTAVATPLAFEAVSVPAGTFSNALQLRVRIEAPGYYPQVLDVWLVHGIGSVREIVAYEGLPGSTTWELVSFSVPDIIPDPFAFAPKTVDTPFSTVYSEEITVSGISAPAPVSLSGDDYAQVRINDGQFISGNWSGNPAAMVNNGDRVQMRNLSAPQPGYSRNATLEIGYVKATFTVSTRIDTAPDPFSFIPLIDAPLGVAVMSKYVPMRGMNTPAPISIVGGEYSMNGEPFTSSPGMMCNLCSVAVRVGSAASHGTTVTATVTIGGVSAPFSVTTFVPGQLSSSLFYRSQPGDYIGEGKTKLFNLGPGNPAGIQFNVYGTPWGGISVGVSEPPGGSTYHLELDAPGSNALTPGRYEGAVAFPGSSSPWLDFSGEGRGCSGTGRFDVLEVVYGLEGAVERLAVNFEQHCGSGSAALFGELRINSRLPLGSGAIRQPFADFNADRSSDVLWRNASTGENYIYPMNGTAILATEGYLRTVADQNWQVAGVGDFDGDGRADILWRNRSTGRNYIYFMDGTTIKPTEGYIRTVTDQNWQVAAIGNFNGDGQDDILWRNSVTGENYIYLMDGLAIKPGEGFIRRVADLGWQIVGVGDFNGDGTADILWRHATSGQNYLYPMSGTAILAGEGYLRTVPDPAWQVAGVGDFDGDTQADIFWRHRLSGENYLYPMDGTSIKPGESYLPTVSNPDWQIVGVADYDGDAKTDLLWRNSSTGENYMQFIDGTTIKPSEGFLRTVPPGSWSVVAR